MRAYSVDLRERVLADRDGGMGTSAVAHKYWVSRAWVRRLRQVRRDAGGRPRPSATAGARLGGPRRGHPGGRPRGPRTRPWPSTAAVRPAAVPVGPGPGARRPRPDAKKKSVRASEQDRPDVKAKRDEWKAGQPALDPDELVFVDETWASTNMARTPRPVPGGRAAGHGRAARPLEDDDVRGRPAGRRAGRPGGDRRGR